MTLDIDAELLKLLKPPQVPTMPKLLSYLRSRRKDISPEEWHSDFLQEQTKILSPANFAMRRKQPIEEMLRPKRASRGLVYPGEKPRKKRLYPFLGKQNGN